MITDVSPELARTDLHAHLDERGTIFILPYYAKADESFVNSFLRKLHADKMEEDDIIVFGMPQWMGFANINSNYLENLHAHISIATYIDVTQPDYQSFKLRFTEQYHTIPDLQAFLGYDLIKWIAHTLLTEGKDALTTSQADWNQGVASGFEIRPVYKESDDPAMDNKIPLYYQNGRIHILKYEDQDYHVVK